MIGYHVDRSKKLYVGQTIELFEITISNSDVTKNLDNLYKGYLSNHGEVYAINNYNISDSSHTTEQIFELIRMKDYPHKLSRFQSFFAFQSLDDAICFSENKYPIFEVECNHNNFHIGDMNLIKGNTILQSYTFAHQYWDNYKNISSTMEILIKPPVKILRRIIL